MAVIMLIQTQKVNIIVRLGDLAYSKIFIIFRYPEKRDAICNSPCPNWREFCH